MEARNHGTFHQFRCIAVLNSEIPTPASIAVSCYVKITIASSLSFRSRHDLSINSVTEVSLFLLFKKCLGALAYFFWLSSLLCRRVSMPTAML